MKSVYTGNRLEETNTMLVVRNRSEEAQVITLTYEYKYHQTPDQMWQVIHPRFWSQYADNKAFDVTKLQP